MTYRHIKRKRIKVAEEATPTKLFLKVKKKIKTELFFTLYVK
jgi:hypothetical protein